MQFYWYGYYRFQVISAFFWFCGLAFFQLIIWDKVPILDVPAGILKFVIPAGFLLYPLFIHFKRKREMERGVRIIASKYFGKMPSKRLSTSQKVIMVLVGIGFICGVVFIVIPAIKSSSSSPVQARYAVVRSDALNVRKGPSAEHAVAGVLKKGVRVQVLDSSGTWWRVKSGSIEGYCNSSYLANSAVVGQQAKKGRYSFTPTPFFWGFVVFIIACWGHSMAGGGSSSAPAPSSSAPSSSPAPSNSTQYFYDSSGRSAGSADTRGNTTYFYDSSGRSAGTRTKR